RPTPTTSCATSRTSGGSSPTRRRPTWISRRARSRPAARAPRALRVMSGARRLAASIGASALAHALVLGVALRGERGTLRPPLIAIPVALVGGVGGGGGAAGPATEPAPAAAPAASLVPAPAPPAKLRPRRSAVARRAPMAPL